MKALAAAGAHFISTDFPSLPTYFNSSYQAGVYWSLQTTTHLTDLQHFSIMGTRFRECFSESVRPPQVRLPTAMVCNPLTTGTGLGDTGSTLGIVDSSSGVPSDTTPQCSPAER